MAYMPGHGRIGPARHSPAPWQAGPNPITSVTSLLPFGGYELGQSQDSAIIQHWLMTGGQRSKEKPPAKARGALSLDRLRLVDCAVAIISVRRPLPFQGPSSTALPTGIGGRSIGQGWQQQMLDHDQRPPGSALVS
jgi:hypothetical protein